MMNQWPPDDYPMTTQWRPNDHQNDYLMTIQWLPDDHLVTTQWPPNDHLITTRMTTWWPLDDCMIEFFAFKLNWKMTLSLKMKIVLRNWILPSSWYCSLDLISLIYVTLGAKVYLMWAVRAKYHVRKVWWGKGIR